jgi:serine/threonine-protein kinase
LDPIGVGPSGAVSRAKVFGVAGFERQFAVKRFHPELTATAAMAAMLSAAARAYGSLEHPRIARMSEFGVAQGATFTAVEYVLGLDALRLIAEARLAGVTLAAGGALALVSQAARAVGYAHGRGLTHLGLAPTNVLVTAEGDIKITDFGILSATLPPRPVDMPLLAQRIPYLAPEQLANEATSAATDVFALGVLAYELVTGSRTFKGDTPQDVAAAITAGPPPEPSLPRPIVRVLQRCLARSPFERFPDARALADALDAALRVAPVPGTRKDIGAQVKETLDRLATLNEGQMSGVVALHLGTGPIRRPEEDARRAGPAHDGNAKMTLDLKRPGPKSGGPVTVVGGPATVGGPAPGNGPITIGGPSSSNGPITVGGPLSSGGLAATEGPATTVPDLPQHPLTTVPGVAPPPIPVPAGVASPATALQPGQPGQPGASTLVGVGKTPPLIPPARQMPRPGSSSGLLAAKPPATPAAKRAPTRLETDLSVPIEPASPQASSDSAIHTLDLNDVVSLDSGVVNIVELDALADNAPGESSSAPTRELRAESPDQAAPSAAQSPAASPAPPRFDPIAPRSQPESGNADDLWTLDEDHAFDSDHTPDGEARPTSEHVAASQTILGFGAPSSGAQTPSPHAQLPSTAADHDPFADSDATISLPGSRDDSDPTLGVKPPLPPDRLEPAGEADLEELPPPGAPSSLPTPHMPPGWVTTPPLPAMPLAPGNQAPERPRRRIVGIVLGVIGAAIVGVGAWQVYLRVVAHSPVPQGGRAIVAKPPGDAQVAVAPPIDAAKVAVAPPIDAAQPASAPDASRVATAPIDAGVPPGDATSAPPDAAHIAAVKPGQTTTGDTLAIASTPPGARVFLDGSDTGTTPLRLPGSPDRHTIALLLAGHELYIAQVDGHGTFQIPLKEVTPVNGPAGIKVLRCKDKDRYYVFIDGKPTGQTCPTERIGCEIGPHTVEVYDVVSETRRKWDIVVKDTRLSFRVRVDQ